MVTASKAERERRLHVVPYGKSFRSCSYFLQVKYPHRFPAYRNERRNDGDSSPRYTPATGPFIVRANVGSTVMWSVPPGAFTVTGLFTSPSRTAALAAAQAEDPEAWVSPAPRSQIKMKREWGPVGTTNWTLVRLGKMACRSS